MRSSYTFIIPDREHCHRVDDLLEFLHLKIEEGHQCLYCDRTFEGQVACLRHMLDKNHTRIGTEG